MDSIDLDGGRATLVTRIKDGAQLDGHPVNVVTRLTDINPSCVYVALNGITPYNVGGDVRYDVFLVAPNTDEDVSVTNLQALLEAVLPLLSPADNITYVGLQVPEQSDPYPALRIPVEI